jgi:RNA polymerase sigma-70 factor (ECF subfamily)
VAPHDIEDVLQDILLAAFRGFHRFETTRDTAAPICAWLYGIAWRQVSHYHERAHRRREGVAGLRLKGMLLLADPASDPEQRAVEEERAAIVSAVLARMSLRLRVVLVLHDMLGVPNEAIARELGVKRNTIHNRLRLAREDFRAAVQHMTGEQRQAVWPQRSTRKAHKAQTRSPRRSRP